MFEQGSSLYWCFFIITFNRWQLFSVLANIHELNQKLILSVSWVHYGPWNTAETLPGTIEVLDSFHELNIAEQQPDHDMLYRRAFVFSLAGKMLKEVKRESEKNLRDPLIPENKNAQWTWRQPNHSWWITSITMSFEKISICDYWQRQLSLLKLFLRSWHTMIISDAELATPRTIRHFLGQNLYFISIILLFCVVFMIRFFIILHRLLPHYFTNLACNLNSRKLVFWKCCKQRERF